ncbi:MAG: type V CRISPR-associated endonuclease Cas1 [Oscillospiraceae bacterium]|nr:type V CRISPR-associated endonuclease Cas1 [Oscillospiraceae bacterium]
MISSLDFSKKQIIIVLFNEGEKMSFSNDNIIVKTADNRIKFQCSCYRLFLIFAVGNCSITSVVISKARKFGFFIAFMSAGFRLYSIIGADKDSNTLLKTKQYQYDGLGLAKHITQNKISNQIKTLKLVRDKSISQKEAIHTLSAYIEQIESCKELSEIMAYEGLAAKLYFKNHFNNILWQGRQPRVKRDIVNSVLDIGYSLLFAFIDALLSSYGFDTYKGVMHKQFYMRKSLVCDIVEPFRPLIDIQIKKSINLKQIKKEDFLIINNQYRLKWELSAKYMQFLMSPIIENKDLIFEYIQSYYRAFMKNISADKFPTFDIGG